MNRYKKSILLACSFLFCFSLLSCQNNETRNIIMCQRLIVTEKGQDSDNIKELTFAYPLHTIIVPSILDELVLSYFGDYTPVFSSYYFDKAGLYRLNDYYLNENTTFYFAVPYYHNI